MPLAKKGQRFGGRQKNTPNKHTRELKEMIEGALKAAGGEEYLVRQADENPAAFMSLVGRTLPRDVRAQITGALKVVLDGGHKG